MARSHTTVLAAFAALLACAAASDMFGGENVAHLTSATYEEKINDGKIYLIKYYAPWCGHCKRLAPTWSELGDAFKAVEDVVIAHVDCTQDKEVCTSAQVKGYPTLKIMYKGEEYKAYRGARDLPSLKDFVEEARRDLLTES